MDLRQRPAAGGLTNTLSPEALMSDHSDFVTRCPACDRAFHVHAQQLEAADGQVRCGQCLTAFDARKHSTGVRLTFELVPGPDEETIRSSALSLDLEDGNGPPLDDRAHDSLRGLDQPVELPVAGTRSSLLWRTGAWSLLLLLALTLTAQVLWHEREQLAQNPATRPLMDDLCGLIGCGIEPYRNAAALRSGNFSLRSLSRQDNVLLLTLTIHNDASLPQPLPGLDLAFTSTDNRIIAARRFLPAEYLDPELIKSWQQEHGSTSLPELPAGGSLDVQLALADPGEEAVNYELAFSQH